jgi:hypothetical protein
VSVFGGDGGAAIQRNPLSWYITYLQSDGFVRIWRMSDLKKCRPYIRKGVPLYDSASAAAKFRDFKQVSDVRIPALEDCRLYSFTLGLIECQVYSM